MNESFKKGFEKTALPSMKSVVTVGTKINPMAGLPKPRSVTPQMRSAVSDASSAAKVPGASTVFKPKSPSL